MSVASILQQMAESASRARLTRGALIGQSVANLSAVPAQIMVDRERERLQQRLFARQDVQDRMAVDTYQRRTRSEDTDLRKEQALRDAIAAGFGDNPDPQGFSVQRAGEVAIARGFPDLVPTIGKIHEDFLPRLTSAAPGTAMRDPTGKVVPGSEIAPVKPDYTINDQRFSGATNQPVGAPVPAPASPVRVGTFEDYVANRYAPEKGKKAEELTAVEIEDARKRYGQADDRAIKITVPGASGPLTPEGVEFAATQYRLTGKMPALGMSNSEARAAILNEAAKQTKELRQTPVHAIQRQAAYRADEGALKRMTTMAAAAESFEAKALGQADIIAELSEKVPRTQYPIINTAILAGKREILGDSNTQQLFNALTTFTAEYAKIMEGSTGSVAASSDASRKAAASLISAKLNKGTLKDTLDLMKREMRLSIQGYAATINHITERMGGQPTTPTRGVSVTAPDGSVHRFDTQAQADAFKKLAGIP